MEPFLFTVDFLLGKQNLFLSGLMSSPLRRMGEFDDIEVSSILRYLAEYRLYFEGENEPLPEDVLSICYRLSSGRQYNDFIESVGEGFVILLLNFINYIILIILSVSFLKLSNAWSL